MSSMLNGCSSILDKIKFISSMLNGSPSTPEQIKFVLG